MGDGYTKIRNGLISELAKLKLSSPSSYMVLFAVIRNTICFHRSQHEISNTFLMNATGLSKRSVIRAIQELSDAGIIQIIEDSSGHRPRLIRFRGDNPDTSRGDRCDTSRGDNPDTQEKKEIKEKIKKENIKRKVNSFTKMEAHDVDWDAIAEELDRQMIGGWNGN